MAHVFLRSLLVANKLSGSDSVLDKKNRRTQSYVYVTLALISAYIIDKNVTVTSHRHHAPVTHRSQ
ncbi:hypothetical protein, partial [Bacillus licheniformis]|uniref:hypothetical protein n=1 Tax=Bacillus licheniformis TaxID=1402 RepID=UPI001C944E14